MSEALAPVVAVDRPEIARPGAAAVRAARGDRRRGAGGRRAVPGVFRGRDRERPDAGRVRAGGGAVPGVVRVARPDATGDRAAPRGGLHPDASRVGANGQAAPRGDPARASAPAAAPAEQRKARRSLTPPPAPAEAQPLASGAGDVAADAQDRARGQRND